MPFAPPYYPLSRTSRSKRLPPNPVTIPSQVNRANEATCPGFHNAFIVFTEGSRGWNEKPHEMCIEYYRANPRKKRQQRQPPQRPPQTQGARATESEPISKTSNIPDQECPISRRRLHNRNTTTYVTVLKSLAMQLDHHIFSRGEWKRTRLPDHSMVPARPGRTGSFTGYPPQTSISKYFNSKHWRAIGLVVTDRPPSVRFLSRRSPLHKPLPISSQPLAHIHRGSVLCQAHRTVWHQ